VSPAGDGSGGGGETVVIDAATKTSANGS
jgi:hypothetical protein